MKQETKDSIITTIANTIIKVLFILIFAVVFMFVWDLTMPDLMSVPEITYRQAVGLLILSDIIRSDFT